MIKRNLIRHKPWQFFIFQFTASGKKHIVQVGASCLKDAQESIKDSYSKVSGLRAIEITGGDEL